VGYIAPFGIAVETGVVMVVYLHEALDHKLTQGLQLTNADIETAAIEGAVQRLRPKLMTVAAVLASLIPILFESGIGSDVMKPIAAPIVGGMITSTIHVLILVPVFFVLMKERALQHGTLRRSQLGLPVRRGGYPEYIAGLIMIGLARDSEYLLRLDVTARSSGRASQPTTRGRWSLHLSLSFSKNLRMSSIRRSGCSSAAKCPPFGISVLCTTL
jgi:hypothetical protein